MVTTIKDFHPIARKEHICELCGCKIKKGQKYYRQTNIYDGCIYDWIEHEECREIASELDMYDEYNYDDGLSSEYFEDILDDFANDTAEDWQNLTRYEEVCKILEEFKLKGGKK